MVVGVALVGAHGTTSERATVAVASPEPPATAVTPAPQAERVLVLREPREGRAIITTRDLVVSGYLTSGTGPIRVGLASRNGKALAFRSVEPTVIGRPAGDSNPSFVVALPLSGPRDGSPITIQVVAYDRHGVPLDVVRREVILGPVARRVVGADGLLGGIAIGTPISER
jgi:hypothetical protein